jgi:hypothetical protein
MPDTSGVSRFVNECSGMTQAYGENSFFTRSPHSSFGPTVKTSLEAITGGAARGAFGLFPFFFCYDHEQFASGSVF